MSAEKAVIIVCAGRQGRNAYDVLRQTHAVSGFLDDTKSVGETVDGLGVLGPVGWIDDVDRVAAHRWFVAVGDNAARRELTERLNRHDAEIVSAIDPTVSVAATAQIAPGAYLSAFCRVHPGAVIEPGALLESHSAIGCDTRLCAFSRLGMSAYVTGGGSLGDESFLASGAVIGENVSVGARCVIGANSVVLESCGDDQKLYGAPAKPR